MFRTIGSILSVGDICLSVDGLYVFAHFMGYSRIYTNELRFVGSAQLGFRDVPLFDSVRCDRDAPYLYIGLSYRGQRGFSFTMLAAYSNAPNTIIQYVLHAHTDRMFSVPKMLRDLFLLDNNKVDELKHKCVLILLQQHIVMDVRLHICYFLCNAFHADYVSYCEEVQ